MQKISSYYELEVNQKDMDCIDINMDGDTKLFINPTLLKNSTYEPFAKFGTDKVESFFKKIFELYSSGDREKALMLFTSSGETNANHLGYSQGRSRGNGASKRALAKLFDTILQTGALAEEIMTKPMSILVFAHDFGEDRMSDLITSILKEEFVQYTLEQAGKYGIEIEPEEIDYGNCWNEKKSSWENLKARWVKGSDGKPLILTPKQVVSEQYGFSVTDYVTKVVWMWRKDYHVTNRTSLSRPKYDRDGTLTYKAPTNIMLREQEIDGEYFNEQGKWKLYAIDMTIENPELYNQYFKRYLEAGAAGKAQRLSDNEISRVVDNSEE